MSVEHVTDGFSEWLYAFVPSTRVSRATERRALIGCEGGFEKNKGQVEARYEERLTGALVEVTAR